MGRGRGKGNPKSDPKPGGRLDRKVVIEYSSDESLDEDNPQPVEGTGALKCVKKQVHLTLPTTPAHVTTTESFATFFINHGLTKALRKVFEKRGWSTDQMQELITNFQRKHGKKVPLPKLYMDEDTSDSEGLELQDGSVVGKKATGGSSGGSKPGRKLSTGGSSSGGAGGSGGGGGSASTSGSGGVGGSGGDDPGRGRKRGRDDDPDDNPNKRRKTGEPSKRPKPPMARKEPRKGQPMYGGQYIGPGVRWVLFIPQSIGTWLLCTFRRRRKEPSWGSEYWTGPKPSWRRYIVREWKVDRSSHTDTELEQWCCVTFVTSRRVQLSSFESCLSRGW